MRRTILGFLVASLTSAGLVSALDQPRHLGAAIRSQERLTSNRPFNAGAFNDLGNLLTLAGDLERAEEAYRRALEIAPENAVVHYNLGLLLRQTGHSKGALRELKQVVELDSSDAWGHYQLGVLLEERRRNSKAVQHFAQAFILEPELAVLEVNPQLLDSKLLSRSLTLAYTERVARLGTAPRQYQQPKRITRLLVPETKRTSTTTAGEEQRPGKRERSKARRKRKAGQSGDS